MALRAYGGVLRLSQKLLKAFFLSQNPLGLAGAKVNLKSNLIFRRYFIP
jgi:hypothetical protein